MILYNTMLDFSVCVCYRSVFFSGGNGRGTSADCGRATLTWISTLTFASCAYRATLTSSVTLTWSSGYFGSARRYGYKGRTSCVQGGGRK